MQWPPAFSTDFAGPYQNFPSDKSGLVPRSAGFHRFRPDGIKNCESPSRLRRLSVRIRADAAFAKPEFYEALEERGVRYAIRIPASDSLERDIAELPTRPVGRPTHKPVVWYKSFRYQAAS